MCFGLVGVAAAHGAFARIWRMFTNFVACAFSNSSNSNPQFVSHLHFGDTEKSSMFRHGAMAGGCFWSASSSPVREPGAQLKPPSPFRLSPGREKAKRDARVPGSTLTHRLRLARNLSEKIVCDPGTWEPWRCDGAAGGGQSAMLKI